MFTIGGLCLGPSLWRPPEGRRELNTALTRGGRFESERKEALSLKRTLFGDLEFQKGVAQLCGFVPSSDKAIILELVCLIPARLLRVEGVHSNPLSIAYHQYYPTQNLLPEALTSLFERRFLMLLAFFALRGLSILVGRNKTWSQENLYLSAWFVAARAFAS